MEPFTPVKIPSCDAEKYAGVSIRQFPRGADQGEIIELLCTNGLPEEKKESVTFRANGVVTISDLDSTTSKTLIDAIHGKLNFGKKLYCNGVIPLTPEKPSTAPVPADALPSPTATPATSTGTPSLSTIAIDPSNKSPAFLAAVQTFSNLELPSNIDLVRRHSLSSINRTPPGDSIAAEILLTPRPDLLRTKSMLNDLKDLRERLSEIFYYQSIV